MLQPNDHAALSVQLAEVSDPESSTGLCRSLGVCGCGCACVALASVPADGISWNRFLGPSRQLDPFINFGSAVVSMLPVFLGYYHLARFGALLGLVVSAAMYFATQVCAGFIFVFQFVGESVALQEVTCVGLWLLGSLILWTHIKASNSSAVRDAQRSLHLVAHPRIL